jgi:N-acetylglucosaminyldiphosphoundecaprenol N-acetyl-beta-D-mannosaminyltransferase
VVETSRIIELCNAARPDVLFLGLGTPKQEFWAAANMDRLDVGPILCVGGAFDFVAGRTVRAPRLVQTVGMEWAWRLAHEPKRLWKRYLVRDSRFIGLAVREAITALRHR